MRLVATVNVGGAWYAEHTTPWMRRYAERTVADFREFPSFEAPSAGRWPGWRKLDVLRDFAAQDRHESLLLLDADVLVLPDCPDLFPRIGRRPLAVEDMGRPAADRRYVDWCVRHLAERPNHARYFNSGVMAVSLDAARRLAPLLGGPFADEPFWDQDYLNLRVQNRIGVEFLPVAFNWLAPQFADAALQQHMVHFVGEHKRLLPAFVERLERERERGASAPWFRESSDR